MSVPFLRVQDLRCHFGGLKALDGASFDVCANRITGLIGPNGAGKTTMFNCVSGLLPKTSGAVIFDGRDITEAAPNQISNQGLVRTFQLARGCPRMSVFEHLMLYAPRQRGEGIIAGLVRPLAVRQQEARVREEAFALAVRLKLDHVIDNLVTNLSGGQKKLLEIGRALMAHPKLLLLDEPMAGVNPTLVEQIAQQLAQIRDEGVSIVLIEHEMALIEQLCDEVIVMAQGKFFVRGSFTEVAANRDVQEAYLGIRE
jgi:ABC-type branched-subunit amino acid transport system ATPase component